MNKYEEIARDIYNDIASGKYEPGSQLALERKCVFNMVLAESLLKEL